MSDAYTVNARCSNCGWIGEMTSLGPLSAKPEPIQIVGTVETSGLGYIIMYSTRHIVN